MISPQGRAVQQAQQRIDKARAKYVRVLVAGMVAGDDYFRQPLDEAARLWPKLVREEVIRAGGIVYQG